MNNDKAITPQVLLTPHPSEDACKNLSDYVTAVLNGIENARNPETVCLDIVAMRIHRIQPGKNKSDNN